MSKTYDVVATIGTYEKDGEKKYVTRNVGAIIETAKGPRLKLDSCFNPAGCQRSEDGGVWLALFEPKQDGLRQPPGQTPSQPPSSNRYDDFCDDIGF